MSPYKHTPHQVEEILTKDRDSAWMWLLSVEIPLASGEKSTLRLARNSKAIYFGEFDDGSRIQYFPSAIDVSNVSQDSEGSLNSISVSVSNVSREIGALFEAYDALINEKAKLLLVSSADLLGGPYWQIEGTVAGASQPDHSRLSITIGQVNTQRINFPRERILRRRCRFAYGGTRCGYDTTRAGALQSCDKTPFGANGCKVHGEDEAAAGVTVLHPLNYGGFLGTPRRSGVGT